MIGKTLGHYELTGELGAGGMGVVYRANDSRLGREVAIKVLPPELAADPERLARFEREAKVLASLNNPHIGAIYGLEEAEGQRFLVLELVEGKNLAERMKEGPMLVEEALPMALQIARALEAAHDNGVVHRDLKPANVVVNESGQAKVLDFGLAKALETAAASGSSPSMSMSPTLTQDMTGAGMILGTAAYMAPEQAKGKAVDRRADIWAFGIVLFELLTGQRTFRGETVSETLAAVMMKDVDWGRLGTTVPAPIERLLRRCLEKDPENRLQAIGEARIALEEYLADPAAATAAVAPLAVPAQSLWKTAVPWAVAALFALVALAAIWAPRWAAEAPPSSLMRLRVEISPETPLWTANGASAVLSPDGTRLAYVSTAAGARNLYLRNLDQLESTMISGSQDAYSAFFSPDGEWLAFFTPNSLKKVSVFGGTPLTIAEASLNRGGSWAADGTIAYAPSPASGLMQIPDTGGEPRPLTELDTEAGEVTHRWPQVLPGGRAVLFTVHSSGAGFDDARIEVLDLEKNERKVLHHGASFGRYVPTGHVVYVREGTLYALPFDLERLEVTGSPSPLLEDLTAHPNHGSAEFSFSDTGALVYSRGSSTSAQRSLVWVDRSGASSAISADLNSYGTPSLSPDGTRLAVVVGQGDEADIWVHELERGVATRLTFTDKGEWNPIWTPDGASIAFGSARESAGSIYLKPADGSGEAVRLTESESPQAPISWSPDGEVLVYTELGGSQGWNIYTLEPGAGEEPQPFVQTDFDEWGGWFSPDGRWVAYISMESGSTEIYVRPFPGPGGKWQVSKGGGLGPRWSRDGTEIFYRNVNEDRAMVVAVDAGIAAFRSGTPQELFADPYFSGAGGDWDVGLDGQRFLMLEEHGEEGAGLDRTHVILVLDWFEQLRALGASGRR